MNRHDIPSMNGSASEHQSQGGEIAQISTALEAIYNPRASNQQRKEATILLDEAKNLPNAPFIGHELAADRSHPAPVRHFGLHLIESAAKYRWNTYTADQTEALKSWIVDLAQNASEDDLPFLRNKIAHVWAEIVKRAWPDEWVDMDERLQELWSSKPALQDIVLHILGTLSEEIFSRDDASSLSSGPRLAKGVVEIFVPGNISAQTSAKFNHEPIKCGEEGWLSRVSNTLALELREQTERSVTRSVQCLETIRSALTWLPFTAVASTSCLDTLCVGLCSQSVTVKVASVEALHALYHRGQFTDQDVESLVSPFFRPQGVQLLSEIYHSVQLNADDPDTESYTLLKKLSEVMCALGGFLESRTALVLQNIDISHYLKLLSDIFRHDSLVVSIPALYAWTRIAPLEKQQLRDVVMDMLATLLDTCSERIIRFDALPAGSTSAILQFLNSDFDTIPERHAFVGNYRKYCHDLIEEVVRLSAIEAIQHVISQADTLLGPISSESATFDASSYTGSSSLWLRVDAQATVITISIKSYLRWLQYHANEEYKRTGKYAQLLEDLKVWCSKVLQNDTSDPQIRRRLIQLVSEIIINLFPSDSTYPLTLCDHLFLGHRVYPNGSESYNEAIKELEFAETNQLQKLVSRFSNVYASVLPEMEEKVRSISQRTELDRRVSLDFRAVLLTIVQRSTVLSTEERHARLQSMIEPLAEAWQNPSLTSAVSSFEAFLKLLGLEGMPEYFLACDAHKLADWTTQKLDDKGNSLRDRISKSVETLPLGETKSLLSASTHHIAHGTKEYELIKAQWQKAIPSILPNLLQMLSHAHAFSNPAKWSSFPDEMQQIIQRALVDRVWQSGISSESRDDFYVKVRDSKQTLEGLGSAVRGAIRTVRELSYWILHCMASFEDAFYNLNDFSETLAIALCQDSHTLSPHQFATLLRLFNAIIDGCPYEYRRAFLPPLMKYLMHKMDGKIVSEWDELSKRKEQASTSEEKLDQEMKSESILRQLTYSGVCLVSGFTSLPKPDAKGDPTGTPSLRSLVFNDKELLELVAVFCTHCMRIQDHRCASLAMRILRGLMSDLAGEPSGGDYEVDEGLMAQTSEYFSDEVLKVAITSLHDPYFVDMQKEIAATIGSIIAYFLPKTDTARRVLLSLPRMSEEQIDTPLRLIVETRSERQHRTLVLDMLESLRGVSIHEQGKVLLAGGSSRRRERKTIQQQYSAMDETPTGIQRGGSPELSGVAELLR